MVGKDIAPGTPESYKAWEGTKKGPARGGRNRAIATMVQDGMTLQSVADEHGMTRERVRQIAKAHGVVPRERGRATNAKPPTPKMTPEVVAGAIERHSNGESIKDIATDLGVVHRYLRKLLADAGVQLTDARIRVTPEIEQEIVRRLNNNESIQGVAEALGIHWMTVRRYRDKHAIKSDARKSAGKTESPVDPSPDYTPEARARSRRAGNERAKAMASGPESINKWANENDGWKVSRTTDFGPVLRKDVNSHTFMLFRGEESSQVGWEVRMKNRWGVSYLTPENKPHTFDQALKLVNTYFSTHAGKTESPVTPAKRDMKESSGIASTTNKAADAAVAAHTAHTIQESEDMYGKKSGKCSCWKGYDRVPGTTPCAKGSCEKCDHMRKTKRLKDDVIESLTEGTIRAPKGEKMVKGPGGGMGFWRNIRGHSVFMVPGESFGKTMDTYEKKYGKLPGPLRQAHAQAVTGRYARQQRDRIARPDVQSMRHAEFAKAFDADLKKMKGGDFESGGPLSPRERAERRRIRKEPNDGMTTSDRQGEEMVTERVAGMSDKELTDLWAKVKHEKGNLSRDVAAEMKRRGASGGPRDMRGAVKRASANRNPDEMHTAAFTASAYGRSLVDENGKRPRANSKTGWSSTGEPSEPFTQKVIDHVTKATGADLSSLNADDRRRLALNAILAMERLSMLRRDGLPTPPGLRKKMKESHAQAERVMRNNWEAGNTNTGTKSPHGFGEPSSSMEMLKKHMADRFRAMSTTTGRPGAFKDGVKPEGGSAESATGMKPGGTANSDWLKSA